MTEAPVAQPPRGAATANAAELSGAARHAVESCPICEETRRRYLFVIHGLPVAQCRGCGLILLYPPPAESELREFYSKALGERDPRRVTPDSKTESEAARRYRHLLAEMGVERGRILLVAPPGHPFAAQARTKGARIDHELSIDEVESRPLSNDAYDAAVVLYQLEKASCPLTALRRIHAALHPDGILLLAVPSLDSWPARTLGTAWTEWRPENRFYFNQTTLHSLLLRAGFGNVWQEPDRRIYTLSHIRERAVAFPRTLLTRLVRLAYRLAPPPARRLRLRVATSGMIVTAQRVAPREIPLVSIVVPAYNEAATFAQLMDALLEKRFSGADKEIIIVESNSRDGTRELALRYAEHPEVRLVLEDRPRGKGHAVRTGFARARGDIVMIQDADLEYDLNDYDALLEPLLSRRALFVLGARHGGAWKMRRFTEQRLLARVMNTAHLFFTGLINVLYRQRLVDPFTMFKLLRRDCLYGLELTCNRFDFDHELVIKLVKKGCRPLEIPVNYRSRSFSEGKKVSFLRDPLTWLWVDLKHVFTGLPRPQRR